MYNFKIGFFYCRVVFPNVQVVASDRPDGSKELSYHGLFKRPPNQQPQGTGMFDGEELK